MNKHTTELLAPAGSFDSLRAAIANGADAVYLGGGKFNARINAGNFSHEELVAAFDYAHERGVKVYITLNTLVKNEELEDALDFAAFCCREGADAIIIQDLGLLNALREKLPEIPLHASTQMTVTNTESVKMLESLGVKRVVLARELSLKEIAFIKEATGTELEVFVHGALCVCFSGQCLMSSFIGGRSGNRGTCAQPCRLPWAISQTGESFSKESYLISPRDLMAIDLLPELIEAGVTSLKLEGRMKSPEYVAVVTGVYRKYLDILNAEGSRGFKVSEEDRTRLLQAFNRGGFTQSYLKGDKDYRKLIYTKHPKNQGVRIGTVTGSQQMYARIELEDTLHMGDGLEIMNDESKPESIIVTAIVQNGQHVRVAEKGTSPLVGDFKTPVKKGSSVYRTLSRQLFDEVKQSYENREGRLVPIEVEFGLSVGKAAELKVQDGEGALVRVYSDMAAEKAINKPLSEDRIIEQLKKTGDTPYRVEKINVDSDKESTIPISVLNSMRREALEKLREHRIKKYKRGLAGVDDDIVEKINGKSQGNFKVISPESCNSKDKDLLEDTKTETTVEIFGEYAVSVQSSKTKGLSEAANFQNTNIKPKDLGLSVFFSSIPELVSKELQECAERVYLPLGSKDSFNAFRSNFNGEIFVYTPSILKDDELDKIAFKIRELFGLFDGIAVGSLGALKSLKNEFPKYKFSAESSFNLFNNEATGLLGGLDVESCVLSPELRLSEVKDFVSCGLKFEATVYGHLPLMTMEYCPSSGETGCGLNCSQCKRNRGFLKDRKGEVFPFVRDELLKRTQIYNAHAMLMDDMKALAETQLSLARLYFTEESDGMSNQIIKHFYCNVKGLDEPEETKITITQLKEKGLTKGHWFRGV